MPPPAAKKPREFKPAKVATGKPGEYQPVAAKGGPPLVADLDGDGMKRGGRVKARMKTGGRVKGC
jgi:hypothetical protein